MVLRDSLEGGNLASARLVSQGTARMEVASGRRVNGARGFPLDKAAGGVEADFIEQRGRVEGSRVGMAWRLEDLLYGSHLDDAAQVHDRHTIADVAQGPKVMGNHQQGKIESPAQIVEEIENLGANRRIQR